MTAVTSGIWNHQASGGQVLKGPASLDSASGSNDSSVATSSATISANDFLTLLVTELQNQDPTADTDPNEYINQLVEVNSLEQLISINQTVTSDLGGSAASTSQTPQVTSGTGLTQSHARGTENRTAQTQTSDAAPSTLTGANAPQPALVQYAPGNLGIPQADPAAQRVANALGGSSRP